MAAPTTSYDAVDQLTAVTFTDLQGNPKPWLSLTTLWASCLPNRVAAGNLQHHYDELGNLIQTQLPDGRWLNRLYYGSGHLHQINLDGQVISDFERDRLHREVLRTQGQLSTRSEYDRSGRLRSRQRRLSQPAIADAGGDAKAIRIRPRRQPDRHDSTSINHARNNANCCITTPRPHHRQPGQPARPAAKPSPTTPPPTCWTARMPVQGWW